MREVSKLQRYAAEDVFFGQSVINWARWFVIAAGTAIVLVTADTADELILGITPVIGLIALNFYTHGKRLAEKPAGAGVVALTSLIDVALVTAAVGLGLGIGISGLDSPFYVAYLPIVLAFAFVMPRTATVLFTAATIGAYTAVCVVTGTAGDATNPLDTMPALESLVTRVVVMAAVGGLGTFFWRIQRDRRAEVASEAFGGGRRPTGE